MSPYTLTKKINRYELMTGREAVQAIRTFPVGYLPLGCLERHGDHLPMGLDAIKAHLVCCQAAEAIGGVVFPPHHYAGIHNMTAKQLSKYTGEWGNIYTDRSAKDNLLEIIAQIQCIGINVLVLYSGHYPPCQVDMLQELAKEFDHSKSFRVIPFYESIILQGDHAGISETSFMLYLKKDLVDLTRISDQNYRDHGWQEHNSPERATVEKGKADVARVILHLKREITAALARL